MSAAGVAVRVSASGGGVVLAMLGFAAALRGDSIASDMRPPRLLPREWE